MSVKAVIFDLDGTLLNTYEDLANAVNFALNRRGFVVHDKEKYKYFCGNGTDVMITRALPENSRNEQTLKAVRELYFDFYDKHSGECTRPYDGITDTLSALKERGIRLAVVSNKIDFMTKSVVKKYFGDIFDFVTGQCDGIIPKPDPNMAFKAMEIMGVDSSECIFVGDTGVDALTGKNAGIFTVGVLWGFRDEAELLENGASAIISRPEELLNYV